MLKEQIFRENHLRCAHGLWKEHLKGGDSAIDATCGRGSDLIILANYLLIPGFTLNKIFVYDIQNRALEIARMRVQNRLCSEQFDQIDWNERCHSKIGSSERGWPISLIVYNFGYLPGGDKDLTTSAETTLLSLNRASELLQPMGVISAMCYPGHPAGAKEAEVVVQFAKRLSGLNWEALIYRQLDAPRAPFLIWLIKY